MLTWHADVAVPTCLQLAEAGGEPAAKALYAAAALLRNNAAGQRAFREAGGIQAVSQILAGPCSVKAQKMALSLASDLQRDGAAQGLADEKLMHALPQLLKCSAEWDFREKVLALVLSSAVQPAERHALCAADLGGRLQDMLVHAKADLRRGDIDGAYYRDLQALISKVTAQAACQN